MTTKEKQLVLESCVDGTNIQLFESDREGTILFLDRTKRSIGRGKYRIKANSILIEGIIMQEDYKDEGLQQRAMSLLKKYYGIHEFHC